MSLAMDRVPQARRLRSRVGLALALALVSGDLGCSRLKSSKRDQGPPMLGRERETNDVYAKLPPDDPGTATAPPRKLASVEDVSADLFGNEGGMVPAGGGSKLVSNRTERAAPATAPDPALVIAGARSALDRMQTYQVFMHRQERVNGTLLPEEDVVLAVRRQPLAIRLTWPEGPHKGREVLYRSDEPGGLMHINPGPPLPRMNLPPDSPLVMRNSRHPITEAGFDSLVSTLESDLKLPGQGNLTASGPEVAAPGDATPQVLTRVKPDGESWRVTLDPRTHLPSVVECTTSNGDLLERYVFRDVQPDPSDLSDPAAFDPTARWGPPRGLFGLGRAARADAPTPR